MIFKKHPVSPALQSHIAYFWTLTSAAATESKRTYRFIPDGNVDWIFHLGEPWTYWFPEGQVEQKKASAHLFGQIKNYLDLQLPTGNLFLFGVNFYPWAAQEIWKFNLDAVTDNSVSLAELGDAELCFLEEAIHETETLEAKIKRVEAFVAQRLAVSRKPSLAPVIQAMEQQATSFSFSDLSISKRRLEQRFKTEIGISPKRFQRTLRINKVISQLIQQPKQSLTQLAYDFHFFDQSHFISDFKQFTGCSPGNFLKAIDPSGPIYNFSVESL